MANWMAATTGATKAQPMDSILTLNPQKPPQVTHLTYKDLKTKSSVRLI